MTNAITLQSAVENHIHGVEPSAFTARYAAAAVAGMPSHSMGISI